MLDQLTYQQMKMHHFKDLIGKDNTVLTDPIKVKKIKRALYNN